MAFTLGLGGAFYHDSSACLVDERGAIVAFVEEERLTRRKHNAGSRSCSMAATHCLRSAGIALEDVEDVAIGWNPAWPESCDEVADEDLIRTLLDPRHFRKGRPSKLTVVEHHLSHAASAFYLSGFPDAAVLVVDGAGDGKSTSLYHGTRAGLRPLFQLPYTQSLGWFYESVGEFLGLGDGTSGAGKLMGLAAHGRPRFALDFLRLVDGGYRIDLSRYGVPPDSAASATGDDPSYFRRLKSAYAAAFAALGIPETADGRYAQPPYDYRPEPGFQGAHADLAASAQAALEAALLQLSRRALHETGSRNLCVAGGVGFNCAANGVLFRQSGAEELFVQPVSGDAGCAIGAALEAVRRKGRLPIPSERLRSTAFGPSFSDAQVAAALDRARISYEHVGARITDVAARAIASGAIIGWFQGPCEGGPRALGNRSILADPRSVAQRDRVNGDVKRRETWRPLAPSIASHARDDFLVGSAPVDFMNVACAATPHAKATIPATVHVDGSVRPQLVTDAANPLFAELLRRFEHETGVPALLNTSFNQRDEPIVCAPIDAIRTFYSTPLDALAMGGFFVAK